MVKQALFFLILFIGSVHGQTTDGYASQFLSRLSPNEGLSQSYAIKTVQDNQGFIWVATDMGLNRFDGYQVKTIFGPNNIFSTEAIVTLFIDHNEYLWVSTASSGLYRLNPADLTIKQFFTGKFKVDDKITAQVSTMIQGENNTLWLGISDNVYQLNVKTGLLSLYLSLNSDDELARDLYLDGRWLYCASSKGLFRIDTESGTSVLIPHRPKTAVSIDSNNTKRLVFDEKLGLLVGTVDGLYQLKDIDINSPEKNTAIQLLNHFNVWDMLRYENDYLVATDKGLYRLNRETLELTFILKFSDSRFQITDDNIRDLFIDNNNNVWLSSKSQGVIIWSPLTQRFRHISASTEPALSHDNVWAIYQDKDDILWVGTDNGLNRLNLLNQENNIYLYSLDLKAISGEQNVRRIFPYQGDENLLWIVNDIGLNIFNKTTGHLTKPKYSEEMANIVNEQWTNGYYVIDNESIVFFTSDNHYIYNSISGKVKVLDTLNNLTKAELSWNFISDIPEQKKICFIGRIRSFISL